MDSIPAKTVLLVEDSPEDAALMRRVFRKCGIPGNLEIVTDGTVTEDFLLERGGSGNNLPALILLDLKLPKITGIEILKKLRSNARTSLIPVVILTSSEEKKDIADAYSAGSTGYIVKPVDFARLCELIRLTCSYWLTLNAPPPRR